MRLLMSIGYGPDSNDVLTAARGLCIHPVSMLAMLDGGNETGNYTRIVDMLLSLPREESNRHASTATTLRSLR